MDILKVATKEELIKANQRSLIDFFQMSSENSSVIHYFKRRGIEGLFSKIPLRIVNRVIVTNSSSEYLEDEIKNIGNLYEEVGSPLYWEVWTNSPINLVKRLIEHDFQLAGDYAAMGIKLDEIQEEKYNDLEVKRVENKEQAVLLADLFKEIYQLSDTAREDYLKTVLTNGFDQDLINYIGYANGNPVCISSVFYHAGVAGIYNVGTQKAHCRKGYGRKITTKPLIDAKKKGYQYAILQSSDQGEKVYKRMGFEELCRVKSYKR